MIHSSFSNRTGDMNKEPSSATRRSAVPRSRSGCLQCRQRRQKCDEEKPVCGLCWRRGRSCQYGLQVRWGGRPFSRSVFGQCLADRKAPTVSNGQILRIESEQTDSRIESGGEQGDRRSPRLGNKPFVYGLPIGLVSPVESFANAAEKQSQTTCRSSSGRLSTADQLDHDYWQPETPCELQNPLLAAALSPHPDLPPAYRSLLDYFPRVADSFSSNAAVKEAFCHILMPMATATSYLMASMLNLAAVHRINAGLYQNARQVALLRAVAVEQLRPRVAAISNSEAPVETVVATILMLCYAEIVGGGSRAQSWRMHLEGAASLLDPATKQPESQLCWSISSNNTNSTRAFLARCFVSLVGLANMSARPLTDHVLQVALDLASGRRLTGASGHIQSEPRRIDEFLAHSMDLLPIFGEIGTLLRGREDTTTACRAPQRGGTYQAMEQRQKARHLIERIQAMINSRFVFGTLETAASPRSEEFSRVNESFHQAALLHIYQRLSRLPASASEVQKVVRRILDLLSEVELADAPCPGVTILFPLFSAGSGAMWETDRVQVRELLGKMSTAYGLASVRQGLEVLEAIWRHRDEYGELSENISWETFVAGDIDIILY